LPENLDVRGARWTRQWAAKR